MVGVKIGRLPRNWERAFGYEGDARWLAVWWSPAGDEAVYDDGLFYADGNWVFYSDLVDHRLGLALAEAGVPRHALGSSDGEATHCLLLDLQERAVYVAPIGQARAFLREWAVEAIVEEIPRTEEELEDLRQQLEEAIRRFEEEMAQTTFVVCRNCHFGWLVTEDGYDPCPECKGEWLIPSSVLYLERR